MTSPCVSLETLEHLVLNDLPAEQRLALLEHLGECPACNRLVAEVLVTTGARPAERAGLDEGTFKVGDVIGRYEVVGVLGRGATGTVYRARDPLLDREVALKVLHELVALQGVALLDEARALAKVTHQNVVPLYEVGTHEGRSFLVMQLIEGGSLQQWLELPRAWRDVVRRFLDAAKGLAAVHEAGLVHGDFKPANVLVDTQGHVRVADFGFGRPLVRDAVAGASTQGTPAYMAPELFAGEAPGIRSDQFSFFVALYEGLFRARPFLGDARSVVASVFQQRSPQPPGGRVPAWLTRLLVRGLGPREGRFASMHEVVGLLTTGLERSRARTTMLVASVVGALAVGAWWSTQRGPPCVDAGEMAALWNPARSERLRAAFKATGLPFAEASFDSVQHQLEKSVQDWTSMNLSVCEAARGGRQGAELTERQRVCLSGRRETWSAFIESLENANAERVASSVAGVAELPTVSACGDLEQLGATLPLPLEPKLAKQVAEAQRFVAQAQLRFDATDFEPAQQLAETAVALAVDAGYAPAIAAAHYRLGLTLHERGRSAEGLQLLKAAAWQADRSGEFEITVNAAMGVMRIQQEAKQLDDALTWEQHARAALEKLRQPPILTGRFEKAAGGLAFVRRDYPEALRHTREAIRLLSSRLGEDSPTVLGARIQLSDALRRSGAYQEALEVARAAHEVAQRTLGDQHPSSARTLRVIASAESRLGHYAGAAAHYQTTIDVLRRAYGPDSQYVAAELINLGNQDLYLGRPADALNAAEEALRITRAASPRNDALALDVRAMRADALSKLGRTGEAIDELREVVAQERALHVDEVYSTLNTLADLEATRGRFAEARELYREILNHHETVLGPSHPHLIWGLNGLARCSQGLGRFEASVPLLRRALALGLATKSHPDRLADTQFLLAKALAHANPRDPEALELVTAAEVGFRDYPESHSALLEARAWLARTQASSKRR